MVGWLDRDLVTERLRLRQHGVEDQEVLIDLLTDVDVRRFIGGAKTRADAQAIVADRGIDAAWGHFVIAACDEDRVLGTLSFDQKRGPWEVSFQLTRSAWGQGLMSEALGAARDWFFHSTDEGEFIAVTQQTNRRTRSLLARAGGTCAAEFEQYGLPQVQYSHRRDVTLVDTPCFSCTMNDSLTDQPFAEQIAMFTGWRLAHARNTSLPGWLILVAHRHVTSLEQLTEQEAGVLGLAQRAVSAAHRIVLGASKTYSVLFTEAVDHLHVHLIPRMPWFADSETGPGVMRMLGVAEENRIDSREMDSIARRLQRALAT